MAYKSMSPRRSSYRARVASDEPDFCRSDGLTHQQGLCSWLWDQCEDIANQALNTKYIQGIHEGNLNPNDYGGYGVQDAIYCHNATDNLKLVAERANDPAIKKFVEDRITDYQSYTETLFKQWFIQEPSGIKMGPAAQTYSDYETTVAKEKDPLYFLVAMVPCDMLWHWLATKIKDGQRENNVYSFWIIENGGPPSNTLENFIDTHDGGKIKREEALKIFRKCMKGELSFFQSATLPEY